VVEVTEVSALANLHYTCRGVNKFVRVGGWDAV